MLDFFRRHQKYFYAVITVVIVISFSFFGTYGTLTSERSNRDVVAFTAVDGTNVSRSDLEEMVLFISTDSEDKQLFGGAWGPNFLNNGVVRNDLLATGLAGELVASYPELLGDELVTRLQKEKKFTPYSHPQAKFLSVESAWSYFAPQIKEQFDLLRRADNPLDQQAVAARIALYLEARKLPPSLLRQMMLYQERQYGWLAHDPVLERQDLALFGYYTLQDWFGSRFLHVAAEFIINSAKVAESRGYVVTKEEALASLWNSAQQSYKENSKNPNLGVTSVEEYFREQLRRLGIEANKAVKLWQQVLLFRRLFSDGGASAFVDPLLAKQLVGYGREQERGEAYHLLEPLRLKDFRSLQQFEMYLDTIAQRTAQDKISLTLPKVFIPADELTKKAPEFVQKRYLVDVAHIDKRLLQARVSLKDTWAWEVEDANWKALQKQFPELGIKSGANSAERYALLDSLDTVTRERVDAFARTAQVDSHPDWVDEMLASAPVERQILSVRLKGGRPPLPGVDKREEFMALLDAAPIEGAEVSAEALSATAATAAAGLEQFSGDNKNYYRIAVVDRSPSWETLTFAEAKSYDVINPLLDTQLEVYYKKVRETKEKEYKRDDGSWKFFAEVKDKVAEDYFSKVLKAIKDDYALSQSDAKDKVELTPDRAASLRLYPYVRAVYQQQRQGGEAELQLNSDKKAADDRISMLSLPAYQPLDKQWTIETQAWQMERSRPAAGSGGAAAIDPAHAFSLAIGEWSKVFDPPNGDLSFFHVTDKGSPEDLAAVVTQTLATQRLLGDEAQRILMLDVIALIDAKKALSLNYLSDQ